MGNLQRDLTAAKQRAEKTEAENKLLQEAHEKMAKYIADLEQALNEAGPESEPEEEPAKGPSRGSSWTSSSGPDTQSSDDGA